MLGWQLRASACASAHHLGAFKLHNRPCMPVLGNACFAVLMSQSHLWRLQLTHKATRDRLEWACGLPYWSAAEVWNAVCWPLTTLACRMLCHLHAVTVLQGQTQRHVSSTQMNKESSRSHLIMSVIIEATNLQTQNVTRGKLSFVDLAGSER